MPRFNAVCWVKNKGETQSWGAGAEIQEDTFVVCFSYVLFFSKQHTLTPSPLDPSTSRIMLLAACVFVLCVRRGLCLGVKVTLTVNSDNRSFSLPSFLPLPSHTRAEYMKPVRVGCYRRQTTLPAACAERRDLFPAPGKNGLSPVIFGKKIKRGGNGKMKAAAALKHSHTSSYKQTQ